MPATLRQPSGTIAVEQKTSALHQLISRITLERAIACGIFLACLAYLSLFLRYTTLEPDEGIVLQGAERILRGEIPYRDFFSFYTPGSFYLIALVFRLLGDSFIVARFSLAVAGALCSVIAYLLAHRVCARGISIFIALLATTVGVGFRFLVLHNPYSTLFCCLALYAAVRLFETDYNWWAFATGSFASLAVLFEQSKGAGLIAGFTLAVLLLKKPARKSVWTGIALGFALPLLATFGYFAVHRALGVMLSDWFWPLRHYTQANQVPYGWQNWSDSARDTLFHTGPAWIRVVKALAIFPVFFIPALPLLATGILVYLGKRSNLQNRTYYVLVSSTLVGLLASVVAVRADILHFLYLAPLWYLALAWVLGSRDFHSTTLVAARPWLVSLIAITFGILSLALLFTATGARVSVETRRGMVRTKSQDSAIGYIQSHVPAGNYLLVYPYLPLYNYLTATRSPSRYDYFQPGMNTPKQAEEVIASLGSRKPPVLFEPWFAEKFANSWPGTPVSAIAKDPVADYILRNYRLCAMLTSPEGWRFHYMVPREVSCH